MASPDKSTSNLNADSADEIASALLACLSVMLLWHVEPRTRTAMARRTSSCALSLHATLNAWRI